MCTCLSQITLSLLHFSSSCPAIGGYNASLVISRLHMQVIEESKPAQCDCGRTVTSNWDILLPAKSNSATSCIACRTKPNAATYCSCCIQTTHSDNKVKQGAFLMGKACPAGDCSLQQCHTRTCRCHGTPDANMHLHQCEGGPWLSQIGTRNHKLHI